MHNKDDLFCSECLIHDTFFVGGGSWAPDCCPKCRSTDCIRYESLTPVQKTKADKLFDIMWKKKWNL